jgi:hypothetical protein
MKNSVDQVATWMTGYYQFADAAKKLKCKEGTLRHRWVRNRDKFIEYKHYVIERQFAPAVDWKNRRVVYLTEEGLQLMAKLSRGIHC